MFKDFIKKLLFIGLALIGLNGVITLHELGHWSFCKLFNVYTPRFSIGFGPAILKKQIAQTEFVLAAFPVGGYVSIAGVDTDTPAWLMPYSFIYKPYWQKALILLGGVLFNVIFGLIILACYYLSSNQKQGQNSDLEPAQKKESNFIGPLGIINLISKAAQSGFSSYARILALVSLNLALFNLVPLPFLDGGQLAVVTLEALTGKTLSSNIYTPMSTLAFTLFLLFTVFISLKDLVTIIRK